MSAIISRIPIACCISGICYHHVSRSLARCKRGSVVVINVEVAVAP